MKSRLAYVAGLALAFSAALPAQTITGTWQGKLPIPDNPRLVLKIEKSGDGSLHGGLIRIDRSTDGMQLSSVTFAAPDFSIAQIYASTAFHGKLSPDGKLIDGLWTQGDQTYPLIFTLATPETLWKHDGPASIPPMSATADPTFEVATIKPSRPDENNVLFNLHSREFTSSDTSAKELIKVAYNVRGRQVPGGPSWEEDAKFDVVAEPDTEGMPSEAQNRLMVRKLLEDRFQLKVHIGQQIFPVLAATLNKNSSAVVRSDPEFNGHGNYFAAQAPDGQVSVQFSGYTIPQFLGFLMNTFQENLLVDETGLTGLYDITLKVAGRGPQNALNVVDTQDPLMRAAQEAGFKFTLKKEPLPVILVDHIEKPSAN